MIKAEERKKQFKKELAELLSKWGAEINLEDVSNSYDSDEEMYCTLDAIYDDKGCVAEYTEIKFGKSIDRSSG